MGRTKTVHIDLRLTPEEKEHLQLNAKNARMTMSEYLLALDKQKKIIVVDDVPEICMQLAKIGVNINQIARVVNRNQNCSQKQLDMVQSEVGRLHDKMSDILDAIYKAKDNIQV